ncbi:MAG: hypothetical protein ABI690_13385 [Chloroflexota bacterium]
MEAIAKVISRSSKTVRLIGEVVPATIQVVIQCGKLSVTKHLRYEGGQYIGRAYDYRKRTHVHIAFPMSILSGSLKEEVRLKLAA